MSNSMKNPEAHLAGRLLAVEALVMLMLGKHPDARHVIEAADRLLSQAESQTFREGAKDEAYALQMFAAARENLDAISENVRRISALGNDN